ncbi:MAG: acylneuraminate cytidylyltransferase [Spirochaetaceae bacterium 4572_7]|nr:MAG: acylneuraminate cytidylyltransferase [Spirochaetaceae bacterium 4572_7]
MTIAFIPVRGGSKSIPLKNIKIFCGKPLVYWNLKALNDCPKIDKIVVATDSTKIKETVLEFDFPLLEVYDRLPKNAKDASSTEDVMLEYISVNNLDNNDIFILVQATSPLTRSIDFTNALKQYSVGSAESLLSCVRIKRFFWNKNGTPINYNYKNRPRRQDFDGVLLENGAFYINRVSSILRDKNRLSNTIDLYEMPEFTAVEIDEIDDWVYAESLMKKYILKPTITKNIKLFLSDVDGTLTDAGMYYDIHGNELKKFNTHDGKGFELLHNQKIKTGIITSEDTTIVKKRAEKLNVDYLYQGLEHVGKLEMAKRICKKEGITLQEVAYIGDDINCKELLENVGLAACPKNSLDIIKDIPGIIQISKNGGSGAVREFISLILA